MFSKMTSKNGKISRNPFVTSRLIRPYFLKKLLRYYTPKENDVTLQKAYTYAGLLVFATFADLIVYHWYMMGLSALGNEDTSRLLFAHLQKMSQTENWCRFRSWQNN
jgi:hypothetical protein